VKLCNAIVALVVILYSFCALSQQTLGDLPSANISSEAVKGIIVESVDKDSQAEKAGFQPGDILLSWSRDKSEGEIISPFDLTQIMIEQTYRGALKISGFRGHESRTWAVGSDTWGISAIPNLPRSIQPGYREGQELAKAGKLTEAAERWRAIADQVQAPASSWLRVWLLSYAAQSLADGRQWKQADDFYQEAIAQAEEAGPAVTAQLFEEWAKTLESQTKWADAEKYYLKALAQWQKLGTETMSLAFSLCNLGQVSWKAGDLSGAEEYYRRALTIQEKLAPNSLYVISSLNSLGAISDQKGDTANAEEYFRQGLAIARGKLFSGRDYSAAFLINLGTIAHARGDLLHAEELDRQALAINEKLAPGTHSFAIVLGNLGRIARDRGDLDKAEHYHKEALAILEKLAPNSLWVANALGNLGDIALDHGDLANAEKYQRQAMAIRERLAPGPGTAASLSHLAKIAYTRGDYTQAEAYYQQTRAIYEAMAPESSRMAYVINRLGDVAYRQGELEKAEQYYRSALAMQEKLLLESKEHAGTLAALARIMRQKQQSAAAAQYYEQALHVLESETARLGGSEEDRSRFRARYSDYYTEYAELLITEKQPELAFKVLERLRARTLLEMLTEGRIDIHQGVDAALAEKERSVRDSIRAKLNRRERLVDGQHTEEQIATLDAQTAQLLAQLDDVQAQIKKTSPDYAALTQPQPLSVKLVQSELLDADTTLLEYSLGEKRSYVFAVTAESLAVYPLPARASIERAAQQVYDLLTAESHQNASQANATQPQYSLAAARLSQMALGPLVGKLKKRLLVVSDGRLQSIPFAALPVPGSPSLPLIVHHEIVNLPSASILVVLRQEEARRKQAPRILAVLADPVFDKNDIRVKSTPASQVKGSDQDIQRGAEEDTQASIAADSLTRSITDLALTVKGTVYFPRLQHSRQEAMGILAVTLPGQGMQALDFKASRATAMSPVLSQYRIVHFATHGLLDNKHPELSGLVFSLVDETGKPQNGFLRLQDIYNLNLPAELVVLSACETGLGKNIQGEGIIGLTRGFMYAGSARVVASLWKIDDLATAELMAEFYRAMEQKGMRPAAALRAAQIHMWKQPRWTFPYYWAAFQIHGEWK